MVKVNMYMHLAKTLLQLMAICVISALPAMSQAAAGPVPADASKRVDALANDKTPHPPAASAPQKAPERVASYVLGPEDQIIIRAFQAQELSDKPIQITGDGYINLPMIGKVKAAGLSVGALEIALTEKLKNYVRNPQVSVFVAEYHSEPVSVVGSVGNPGVIQLRGRKTLVEVIALAGGLKPDAGNSIVITREIAHGRIPLPGATDDAGGRFSIAKVNLRSVIEARNPQDNILVQTNDVITIPKAQLLYVVGEVQRPGGYALNEKDSITVLQAVALAGGLTGKASTKKAKILHQNRDSSNRTELATNVKKILDGTAPDVALHADDILFVPNSLPKSAGTTALQTAMNMAGAAVFRF
jgi:polysaccharide export outer membrane protein